MIYMTQILSGERKRTAEHEAGSMLLQYALRQEYGLPEVPELAVGTYGKPFFPAYPQIQFNISHSGKWAVCALGQTELGIDIEYGREVKPGLAERTLTERERGWMERNADEKKAFIRLWTLKESYIKTTGEGLRTPLKTVEFLLPEDGKKGEIICNHTGYAFWQKELPEGAYLALCMKQKNIPQDMKKTGILFL